MATGALIAGAIASVVAAGTTATVSAINTKKTNAANRRLQEQMNQYNQEQTDPAYIRQRQEDAGYNAQLLANPNVLGQSATQSSYIPHQPLDTGSIGSSLSQALNTAVSISQVMAENKVKRAQAEQIHIENQYRLADGLSRIRKTLEDVQDVKTRRQLNEILMRYQDRIYQNDLQMSAEQINQIKEQTKGQVMQNVMTSIQMRNFPEIMRLDIANQAAELAVRKQVERLTNKQVQHEIQKIAETIARTELYQEQTVTQQNQSSITASAAEVDRRTIEERVNIIRQEMWRAISNSGSDSPLQWIQSHGAPRRPISYTSGGYGLAPSN